MINDLRVITGKVSEAKEVSKTIHDDKKFYEQLNENSDRIECLLIISVNPLMTANHKTFINEIIELSGFENIYHDEAIVYPMISYEDVTEKNPEYIVFPTDTSDVNEYEKYLEEILKNLISTKAVKEKKISLLILIFYSDLDPELQML